jgi:putative (di)nucleoside polyphosphate hydrolase
MNNPADYRPGIGIILTNQVGNVFVGKRIDTKQGCWQMPQGGIDEGEDAYTAMFRELEEEVGTNKAEIIKELPEWVYYDLPTELQKNFWHGKYKGQRQKWFLLKFLGQDTDINIKTQHPEFEEWRWEDPNNLIDLVIHFKKNLYSFVLKELAIIK